MKTIHTVAFLLIANLLFSQEITKLKTGDIIFQTTQSPASAAIKLATHSKFSHVGLIIDKNGKLYVLEAVQPVSITPLNDFINRGQNNYYEVKRLKSPGQIITPEAVKQLLANAEKVRGINYDLAFDWSDNELYCSELVYKMYKNVFKVELAQPRALKTFDLSSSAVKEQLDFKYGTNIPYNEMMISPQQIYESIFLTSVK